MRLAGWFQKLPEQGSQIYQAVSNQSNCKVESNVVSTKSKASETKLGSLLYKGKFIFDLQEYSLLHNIDLAFFFSTHQYYARTY
jgi:archaellum component FlaF (FlaF/FlaG flagellin family)